MLKYSRSPLLSIMLLGSVDQERKQGPSCFLSFSFAVLSKVVCLLRFDPLEVLKMACLSHPGDQTGLPYSKGGSVSHGLYLLKKQKKIIPRRSPIDFALPLTGENIVSCSFPNQSLPRVLE